MKFVDEVEIVTELKICLTSDQRTLIIDEETGAGIEVLDLTLPFYQLLNGVAEAAREVTKNVH